MATMLTVKTSRRNEFINITRKIAEYVQQSGTTDGAVLVYVPHTTAGITINESADPSVAEDMLMAFDAMVPQEADYRHAEGNSPAHVKASLVGSSVLVPVENKRLALGTWQGVFFCEFDGPRSRKVMMKLL